MNIACKLTVLTLALASATVARKASRAFAERPLREYPMKLREDMRGEADISPVASEIARYHWPTLPAMQAERTQLPLRISILDYRRPGAPLATMTTGMTPMFTRGNTQGPVETFLRYSADGRRLLAYDGAGIVHVFGLENPEPHEIRIITLGLSPERPNFQPVDMEWSPDSGRVAVLFSFRNFHEGVVRVYDAGTGERRWERSVNRVEMGREAWSPDGRKLAVTLLSGQGYNSTSVSYEIPARDMFNLVILDSTSGRLLQRIMTKDLAGPVCFGPDNSVLTAPLHAGPTNRNLFAPERVKVWDATSGKLVRKIASPGRDIHNQLAVSRNGKVLLGYVGKEKVGFVLHDLEVEAMVLDRRFQLFDYESGEVIATSPDLTKAGEGADQMPSRLDPVTPSLRLSPDGRRVLVYWPSRAYGPSVFELQ